MNARLEPGSIDKKIRLVLWGVVTTFLSLIPTAYAAYVSNSVTLFTDFLRCFAEFFAIFLSWLILKKIAKADVLTFNYGFGKLEQMASIIVAMALFTTFLVSLFAAVQRFAHPVPLENGMFGLVFALLSVAGNLYLCLKNYFFDLRNPSPVINSQWRLFRAKTFATVVVASSLGLTMFFDLGKAGYYLDPIGSLILSLFMLYSSYQLVSTSMIDLLDCSAQEHIRLAILKVLIQHESSYLELNDVRTRRSGSKIFVDIFLSFDPDRTIKEIAEKSTVITTRVEQSLPGTEVLIVPTPFKQV